MSGKGGMHNHKSVKFLLLYSAITIIMAGCKSTFPIPSITGQSASIEYHNTEYGFSLTLPTSWTGYTILTEQWQGLVAAPEGEAVEEKGLLISIRHPLWTSANPRQDIPIMVFTLSQWDSLQKGNFHIGAAPIGPSELGRNAKYVFALPARYNYAFPTGFEEVEAILESHPLHIRR
jgi:hypothetical protein